MFPSKNIVEAHVVRAGEKLKVDEIFKHCGQSMPLDAFGTFEEAKEFFDKPELLALHEVGKGALAPSGYLIIHKRDVNYCKLGRKVVNEIIEEWGEPKNFAEAMKIKEEMDRRMALLN